VPRKQLRCVVPIDSFVFTLDISLVSFSRIVDAILTRLKASLTYHSLKGSEVFTVVNVFVV
jgi:hypothetical protein